MIRAVLVTEHEDGTRDNRLILGLSAINILRLAGGKPVAFELNATERLCTAVMIIVGETEEQIKRDLQAIMEEHRDD